MTQGRRSAAALGMTVILGLVSTNAYAAHVAPSQVGGNASCRDLIGDPDAKQFVIQNPSDGTFTDPATGFTVIVDVIQTAQGQTFSFSGASIGVDAVFVKGGPGGNLYSYTTPTTADTGLHAPVNPKNGMFFGLSHISFCWVERARIEVTKASDSPLSKAGDSLTYEITIQNTGNLLLNKRTITDTVLGDLTASGAYDPATPGVGAVTSTCAAQLGVGASCSISVVYTVQSGDPDPLVNVVGAIYDAANASGKVATDSAEHSLNLFQPSFTIAKSGPSVSTAGETVTFSFAITNTSSADSPNLTLVSLSDDRLGSLVSAANAAGCDVLSVAEVCAFTATHVVPASAPDPYSNTVTATYGVAGFPNRLTRSASHAIDLFQPRFTLTKTGDELSKIGDSVTYTFTITNTSSADSPNLTLASITDSRLGDLLSSATGAGCATLSNGETCTFSVSHTIPAGAPDPFANTVTATYSVPGFAVAVSRTASHSVNLFQPGVMVEKTGPLQAEVGETVTYTYTITNTSSTDSPSLVLAAITDDKLGDLASTADTAGCGTLAPGGSCSFTRTYTVTSSDPDPLVNTVSVLYRPTGFPNEVRASASHSIDIVPPPPPPPPPPPAGEGCTPGFWKTHPESWSGFSPGQTLESVFDVPDQFGLDTATLIDALGFEGGTSKQGAAQILLRAGVAALLNAEHSDVDYPMTTAEVISAVNDALTGGRTGMLELASELDAANNQDCTID